MLGMTTAYGSREVPEILVRHRLRIAREYAGLDQAGLAERMGVSRNTVGNAEKGNVELRKIVLNAWALACGVPSYWLLTGNTEDPHPDGPDGGGPDSGLLARRFGAVASAGLVAA